ncbi:MAG TPA: hypothetical protein VGJ37_08410 [Pyrinomonadaceae bacterium]|jgi:hypothetical protein
MRYFAAVISFILLFHIPALAHNGPPFPIVVDQQVGPCVISVWTDPDIGQGSFFVMIQPAPNGSIPNDLSVQLLVQPVSGRLPETSYRAEREDLRGQLQYKTLVNFDVQEQWRVRIKLDSAQGSGETTAFVEPTPQGLGRWDLLLYLLPFLAIGFLWLRAFFSKATKKHKRHKPSV